MKKKEGPPRDPLFVYGQLQRTQQMAHCSTLLKQIASRKARKGEVYWTYTQRVRTAHEPLWNAARGGLSTFK